MHLTFYHFLPIFPNSSYKALIYILLVVVSILVLYHLILCPVVFDVVGSYRFLDMFGDSRVDVYVDNALY